MSPVIDDLMGTALIPASPEAWAPYPLYTTELTPAISHTTFTYPAATAAAAAAATLHAQVSHFEWKNRKLKTDKLSVLTWHRLAAPASGAAATELLSFLRIGSLCL